MKISTDYAVEVMLLGDTEQVTVEHYTEDSPDLALSRVRSFVAMFGERIVSFRRPPEVETENGISKASARFDVRHANFDTEPMRRRLAERAAAMREPTTFGSP